MHTLKFAWDELQDKSLLLAHSGGVDSCVLAHLFLKANVDFSVAHCNFQLRDEASDQDLAFVKKWCDKHGISFFSRTFDTKAYQDLMKKSTQEAARDLRYEWFASLMDEVGFQGLVTAHHLNDQLETFLINATRGTGLSGLLGISERKKIYRPLRGISKKTILNYARENKIKWREDDSNAQCNYLRNKIRHQVVTPLENINPQALTNFNNTLEHLTAANKFIIHSLDQIKKEIFKRKEETTYINIEALNQQKQLHFCLHHWFYPLGFDVHEVAKLLKAQSGKIIRTSTHRLVRDRDQLLLSKLNPDIGSEIPILLEQKTRKLPLNLKWETVTQTTQKKWKTNEAFLDKDLLKNSLYLRHYRKGDYFYPSGMKGKKLLSKFFKDEKYSLLEKEQQWLFCSDGQIVWVVGKRCDRRFLVGSKTKNKLLMRVEQ